MNCKVGEYLSIHADELVKGVGVHMCVYVCGCVRLCGNSCPYVFVCMRVQMCLCVCAFVCV